MLANGNGDGLRSWLQGIRDREDVIDIQGADWRDEVGAITEMLQKQPGSPAALFDHVCDYPAGYRILVNAFNSVQRLAYTLGLDEKQDKLLLSRALCSRLEQLEPVKPAVIKTGPIFENSHEGKEIDLLEFPVPKWHQGDGGRYIGTGCNVITQSHDGSWVNLGTYRVMALSGNQATVHIVPGHHGYLHLQEYYARKERCPVVVATGEDPLLFLASCNDVPAGTSELDWAGGLCGRPVNVVIGPKTGLPIPAEAEIAFEGFIEPDNTAKEGPFGEWTGYYGETTIAPVIDIEAVYHRHNPILLGTPHSKPPDETAFLKAVFRSAMLEKSLRLSGVPNIQGCWAHEIGGGRLLLAVGIKQEHVGHASQAGHVAASCQIGALLGRYIVVVDEDIDVTSLEDVMWAVLTRSDPASSVDIIHRAWGSPLDPRMSPCDKRGRRWATSRAIVDATRPFEWKEHYPRVVANWDGSQVVKKWPFLSEYSKY